MWENFRESVNSGFGCAVNTGKVLSGVRPDKNYPVPGTAVEWLGWFTGVMLGLLLAALPVIIILLLIIGLGELM